jgi:hypothetical protein
MLLRALLVVLVACGGQKAAPAPNGGTGTSPPPNASDLAHCTSADECTLVEACCGCNAGGRRVAIRQDAVAQYDATREQRCGETMCAQVISNDPSCHAEAGCENGSCVVLPHMGGAP